MLFKCHKTEQEFFKMYYFLTEHRNGVHINK